MRKEAEFKTYLMKRFTDDYTVEQHLKNVGYFNTWLKENGYSDLTQANSKQIQGYVDFCHSIPVTHATINIRLGSIRKYFDCLNDLGLIRRNPASGLSVGRKEKKVLQNPFNDTSLHELYNKFQAYLDTKPKSNNVPAKKYELIKLRYKLILSLVVYQGMDTGEIDRLRVSDFNESKGIIFVSGRSRRKSRDLKLEPHQFSPLFKYLQSIPAQQEKLFQMDVLQGMNSILRILKGIEPLVKNAEHLRQSRILVWVSTLPIRVAQDRIGHKCVSSTEEYQRQDTSELLDEINKVHLFR